MSSELRCYNEIIRLERLFEVKDNNGEALCSAAHKGAKVEKRKDGGERSCLQRNLKKEREWRSVGRNTAKVDVADATWQATRRYIKSTASVSHKSYLPPPSTPSPPSAVVAVFCVLSSPSFTLNDRAPHNVSSFADAHRPALLRPVVPLCSLRRTHLPLPASKRRFRKA